MDMSRFARWILYVNGSKWGAYLTKESAQEVAERRRLRGDKVELKLAVEGFKDV